jgi:hypothetical protein
LAREQVTPEEHDKFVLDNNLDGGFFISAQSGENVLTTFYKAAASVSGIELTAHELAFTEKVNCLWPDSVCAPVYTRVPGAVGDRHTGDGWRKSGRNV